MITYLYVCLCIVVTMLIPVVFALLIVALHEMWIGFKEG
jgi:hypothetical protein